jgi:hypothetical protein
VGCSAGAQRRRHDAPTQVSLRRLLAALVILAGVALSAPAGASAGGPLLDQQQTSVAARGARVQGPLSVNPVSWAQTFTAGRSGALDRVELALVKTSDTVGPLIVEIRNVDVGGAPGTDTDVLASAEVPAASVPTGGIPALEFVPVRFESPAEVTAGIQYAIVAYTDGSDVYDWGRAGADLYAGGSPYLSFEWPPTDWSPEQNDDLAFKTFVLSADTTAPTSTATPAPGPVPAGRPPITVTGTATFKTTAGATVGSVGPVRCWNGRGVRVALNATDNTGGAGVDTLTYAASGAQQIASTTVAASALPATVTITAPGVTRLTYSAKDKAANQEQTRSKTVLVGPSNWPPFGCSLPTPGSFAIPVHGSVTVTGTAIIGGRTFPFTTTIRY